MGAGNSGMRPPGQLRPLHVQEEPVPAGRECALVVSTAAAATAADVRHCQPPARLADSLAKNIGTLRGGKGGAGRGVAEPSRSFRAGGGS
jgi:hypothetical protein